MPQSYTFAQTPKARGITVYHKMTFCSYQYTTSCRWKGCFPRWVLVEATHYCLKASRKAVGDELFLFYHYLRAHEMDMERMNTSAGNLWSMNRRQNKPSNVDMLRTKTPARSSLLYKAYPTRSCQPSAIPATSRAPGRWNGWPPADDGARCGTAVTRSHLGHMVKDEAGSGWRVWGRAR